MDDEIDIKSWGMMTRMAALMTMILNDNHGNDDNIDNDHGGNNDDN